MSSLPRIVFLHLALNHRYERSFFGNVFPKCRNDPCLKKARVFEHWDGTFFFSFYRNSDLKILYIFFSCKLKIASFQSFVITVLNNWNKLLHRSLLAFIIIYTVEDTHIYNEFHSDENSIDRTKFYLVKLKSFISNPLART